MQMYMVGGCVRDELLGTPSKDIDFTIVLEKSDKFMREKAFHGIPSYFEFMERRLTMDGFRLIPEARKPEFLTARGFFPDDHPIYPGKPADFVLARKEGDYTDGRRPDTVEPGSLFDDLSRRDFTMNAIAKDGDDFVDWFHGVKDIENKIIRAVGDPWERISEDALRALRAVRFSVTKGFAIESELLDVIDSYEIADLVRGVSDERKREELHKMFSHDTVLSIEKLFRLPNLTDAIFSGRVSLDATMKTRHTNK